MSSIFLLFVCWMGYSGERPSPALTYRVPVHAGAGFRLNDKKKMWWKPNRTSQLCFVNNDADGLLASLPSFFCLLLLRSQSVYFEGQQDPTWKRPSQQWMPFLSAMVSEMRVSFSFQPCLDHESKETTTP